MDRSVSFLGPQQDLEQIVRFVAAEGGVSGELHSVAPGAEGGAFADPGAIIDGVYAVATLLGSTAALLNAVDKWRSWRRDEHQPNDEPPSVVVVVNNDTDQRVNVESSETPPEITVKLSQILDQ